MIKCYNFGIFCLENLISAEKMKLFWSDRWPLLKWGIYYETFLEVTDDHCWSEACPMKLFWKWPMTTVEVKQLKLTTLLLLSGRKKAATIFKVVQCSLLPHTRFFFSLLRFLIIKTFELDQNKNFQRLYTTVTVGMRERGGSTSLYYCNVGDEGERWFNFTLL